jgi:hypothetical protein
MKKHPWSIVLIALSMIFVFSSCGEEDETANLKNSTRFNMVSAVENLMVVGSIDIVSIIEKSDFENCKDAPFEAVAGYKMMVKDNIDPELTGIDITGNNHFAISLKDEEPEYVMFTAKISNQEKVKKTLKDLNIFKGDYKKEESGSRIYEYLSGDDMTVGWDDKDIVIVAGNKIDTEKKVKELLKARFVDAAANAGLDGYLKQADDMNVYFNVEMAMKAAKASKEGEAITEDMLAMSKGAYYIGTGNFNTGDIIYEMNIFGDNFKNSEYNALGTSPVSENFMKYLTNDKLIGFGMASINMDALNNALSLVDEEEIDFDDVQKATGMTVEELVGLFSGEFSLSLMDVISEKVSYATAADMQDEFFDEEMYSYNSEKPMVLFAAGVTDSAKIGTLLREVGKVEVMNGVYKLDKDAYLAFNNDKLIITTDEVTAGFFASGNTYSSYTLPSATSVSKPLYAFYNTDVTNMPNGILKMAETEEGQMGLQFADLYELVDFKGDINKMSFTVKMKNKNDNALKVITDYIMSVVKDKKLI